MDYTELFDKVFAFKAAKAWRKMKSDDAFVVETREHGIWFCMPLMIKGRTAGMVIQDKSNGLNVLDSFLRSDLPDLLTPYELHEVMTAGTSYSVMFCDKSHAEDEWHFDALQEYLDMKGIRACGASFYPSFKVQYPRCVPWGIEKPEEAKILSALLDAMCAYSDYLAAGKLQLGCVEWSDKNARLDLIKEVAPGKFEPRIYKGSLTDREYASPCFNDLEAAKMRRLKCNGSRWGVDYFMLLDPFVDEEVEPGMMPNEPPHFPDVLAVVDETRGGTLALLLADTRKGDFSGPLNGFAGAIKELGRPREIDVCSERSYALLKKVCKQLSIKLVLKDDMERLLEFRENVLHNWQEVFDELLEESGELEPVDFDALEDFDEEAEDDGAEHLTQDKMVSMCVDLIAKQGPRVARKMAMFFHDHMPIDFRNMSDDDLASMSYILLLAYDKSLHNVLRDFQNELLRRAKSGRIHGMQFLR